MVNSNVSACRLLVHQVPIRNMRDLLFMEWSLLFNTGSKIYTGFQTCLAKVLKCFASNVLKGHHNSAFQVFHDFKWAVIFMCTCISPRRRLSLAFDSDFGTFTQIGVLANATAELVSTGLLWRIRHAVFIRIAYLLSFWFPPHLAEIDENSSLGSFSVRSLEFMYRSFHFPRNAW